MKRSKSKQETLKRKEETFLLYKGGTSVPEIAKRMGLSERMIYRYIDEYELVRLRKWKAKLEEALQITPMDAPVSQLLAVLQARD